MEISKVCVYAQDFINFTIPQVLRGFYKGSLY